MSVSFKLIFTVILVLCCSPAVADDWKLLSGRVIGVVDGDTLDMLDADRATHRIRLMGIDSPERRQPYYGRAKEHLAGLTFGRDVEVRWRHYDSRGKRPVGQVFFDGQDVNLAMVTAGLAWWAVDYRREQLPSDRRAYADAEASARAARAGLWADPDPVPPWQFRHGKR